MHNKKGFTLLELLIAATMMAVLATMGTVAYRHAISETRIQDAKNKLEVAATGMRRYMLDHPNDVYTGGSSELSAIQNGSGAWAAVNELSCPKTIGFTADKLIKCDYLENREWTSDEILMVTCGGVKTGTLCASSPVANPLVCMSGKANNRLDTRYRQDKGYVYCYSEDGVGETLGS